MMRAYQSYNLAIILQLCFLCLAASPILPSASNTLTQTTSEDTENSTLNLTLADLRAPLPQQPYFYVVPHSHVTIKFQAFGRRLPPSNVLQCLLLAANDVNLHFTSPQTPLETNAIRTTSASVRLVLYPAAVRNRITWAKWGLAIRGITEFMTRFEFVDLDYYILDGEAGDTVVGAGLISNR